MRPRTHGDMFQFIVICNTAVKNINLGRLDLQIDAEVIMYIPNGLEPDALCLLLSVS